MAVSGASFEGPMWCGAAHNYFSFQDAPLIDEILEELVNFLVHTQK